MMFGLDLLGAAMFSDLAIREFPKGWALGVFAVEFGDAFPTVKRIVESGRCPLVRVQLTWSRNRHIYTDEHFAVAKREAARYERLAIANPKVQFELSTFCEHNLQDPDRYHDVIARIAPHCRIINSPYQGAFSKKYRNEVHGSKAPPKGDYNYSYDGTGAVDSNVPKMRARHKRAKVFFFWTYQFNGKRNGATTDDHGNPLPYIPPTEREFWPDSELIDSVIYLHRPKGKAKIDAKVKTLYKSHSDQQNPKPVGRELNPVIITPKQTDCIELVAKNGQVVGIAPYFGTYKDGRHRYYAQVMGYQLAEKAKRIQDGSPIVRLRCAGKWLGTVNPAHRQGEFRD
jgi:hypothetical protein